MSSKAVEAFAGVGTAKQREQRLKQARKLVAQARESAALGRCEEAEHLFKHGLQIMLPLLPASDPEPCTVSLEAGDMWISQHEFAKAEPFYTSAHRTLSQARELRQHKRKALRSLGFLYYLQGSVQYSRSACQMEKWKQAEAVLLEVVADTQEENGRRSEELVDPLRNLASLYVKMGDYHRSEMMFRRCIGIQLVHGGVEDGTVALTRQQLALVLERRDHRRMEESARKIQEGFRVFRAKKELKTRRSQRDAGGGGRKAANTAGYYTPGTEELWAEEENETRGGGAGDVVEVPVAAAEAAVEQPGGAASLFTRIPLCGRPFTPHQVFPPAGDLKLTTEEIELLQCFPHLSSVPDTAVV